MCYSFYGIMYFKKLFKKNAKMCNRHKLDASKERKQKLETI